MLTKTRLARILADMDDTDTIGDLLTAWQNAMGFNDSEAARHCGLTPQHYWKIRRNERTDLRPDTFNKLAAGTGLPYERIVVACAHARNRKANEQQPKALPVTA